MCIRDSYQYVQLDRIETDATSKKTSRVELKNPFLEVEQELWSRDSQRLTLLVDPGRIKQGLASREEAGPIFESGSRYELTISGEWPDSKGNLLNEGSDVVHSIEVGKVDDQCPVPSDWKITPPKPKTKQALKIKFNAPLDSAVAERMIRIFKVQDNVASKPSEVDLAAKINVDQTELELTPGENWLPGNLSLIHI